MTNPFFAVELPASLRGWTSLTELTDAAVLRDRVAAILKALGTGPLRAAASVDFLGVTARLVAPVMLALVEQGSAPALGLDTVWWRPAPSPSPMRLAFTAAGTTDSLERAVLDPVVTPLLDAYAATFALSRTVLHDNVGSACNGAAVQLGRGDPSYVRTSCCLIYHFDGVGLCGDCVLRTRSR